MDVIDSMMLIADLSAVEIVSDSVTNLASRIKAALEKDPAARSEEEKSLVAKVETMGLCRLFKVAIKLA